jgi:hypothetical protein
MSERWRWPRFHPQVICQSTSVDWGSDGETEERGKGDSHQGSIQTSRDFNRKTALVSGQTKCMYHKERLTTAETFAQHHPPQQIRNSASPAPVPAPPLESSCSHRQQLLPLLPLPPVPPRRHLHLHLDSSPSSSSSSRITFPGDHCSSASCGLYFSAHAGHSLLRGEAIRRSDGGGQVQSRSA